MLYHSRGHKMGQSGFTIVELIIAMVLLGIVVGFTYTFFNTTINQYFGLQRDADAFYSLAGHYQRIANVLRGVTDVTSAEANEITTYAYFSPNDANVSIIRYYIENGDMLAEVTPMTANPPAGTPLDGEKRTYTIINDFYSASGVDTFVYLDAGGTALTLPISDLHTIKGIKVNLAVASEAPSTNTQALTLQVSLRNRKTNL